MDQDRAILSAAFAFRDRSVEPTVVTERLRAILPASIEDIPASDQKALGDSVLRTIATDPQAVTWFEHAIDALKSFGGAKSPVDALVYVCPFGDTRWSRPSILDDIPDCTVHHVPLELI